MNLQNQPNERSCLVTSFAMCLSTKTEILFAEVGHDGMEVIYPENIPPYDTRPFCPEELYPSCLKRGYSCVAVNRFNAMSMPHGLHVIRTSFFEYIMQYSGVISCREGHSVAWDKQYIFDPVGKKYPLEKLKYQPDTFIIIEREIEKYYVSRQIESKVQFFTSIFPNT